MIISPTVARKTGNKTNTSANIKQLQESESLQCNSAEDDMGRNINAAMIEVSEQCSASVVIPPEDDDSESNSTEENMGMNMSNTTMADVPEQGSGAASVKEFSAATTLKIVGQGAETTRNQRGMEQWRTLPSDSIKRNRKMSIIL